MFCTVSFIHLGLLFETVSDCLNLDSIWAFTTKKSEKCVPLSYLQLEKREHIKWKLDKRLRHFTIYVSDGQYIPKHNCIKARKNFSGMLLYMMRIGWMILL